MNTVDKKNLSLIEDLVKNHFSMREDSFKIFRNFLYNDDCHNFPFLGEDKRIRINLPEPEKFQSSDLIVYQVERIKKDLERKLNLEMRDFEIGETNIIYKYRFLSILKKIKNGPFSNNTEYDFQEYLQNDFMEYNKYMDYPLLIFFKDKSTAEIIIKRLARAIRSWIKYKRETSINKLAYKQMVISRNFADWFLCSTGERWTSCLSLESKYENAYWTGLPYLTGDPNRVMIYFTDGKQKEWCGIKVDKFGQRVWGLIGEDNKISILKSYPQDYYGEFYLKKIFKEKLNINLKGIEKDFVSKEKITPLFTKSNDPHFIFNDLTIIDRSSLKIRWSSSNGGYQVSDGINIRNSVPYRTGNPHGLKDLIGMKKELHEICYQAVTPEVFIVQNIIGDQGVQFVQGVQGVQFVQGEIRNQQFGFQNGIVEGNLERAIQFNDALEREAEAIRQRRAQEMRREEALERMEILEKVYLPKNIRSMARQLKIKTKRKAQR